MEQQALYQSHIRVGAELRGHTAYESAAGSIMTTRVPAYLRRRLQRHLPKPEVRAGVFWSCSGRQRRQLAVQFAYSILDVESGERAPSPQPVENHLASFTSSHFSQGNGGGKSPPLRNTLAGQYCQSVDSCKNTTKRRRFLFCSLHFVMNLNIY